MSLKDLSDFTFTSKYARYLPEEKRRETWTECVNRSKMMMLEKYKDHPAVIPHIIRAYQDVEAKRVLPSMRGMQFAGAPIEKHNARMFNCIASHVNRLDFFKECFYLLLCGCGTGYSVQKHHIDQLPKMEEPTDDVEACYMVEDTIEGWAEAADTLVKSYFGQYPKIREFKYDKIRAKGTPLSAGGKAPGPEPLRKALDNVTEILEMAKDLRGYLLPIDAYDIICHLADAVISGGVRRSATICVFSADDEDMMKSKTGNWFNINPQRGRSNNSVILKREDTDRSDFAEIMKSVKEFGEPGFVWTDDLEMIVNPCVEIGLLPIDEDTGATGWQGCNLSTINVAAIKDEFDFYSACQSAAVIGTLQAGFTRFPFLGEVSERIFEREALLGVSATGWMEKPDIVFREDVQRNGAEVVTTTNRMIAEMIDINPAARTTCVKPEGTASCVLGTSSGIHPHHSKRYIRRVQANKLDPVYRHYRETNSVACEPSVWSANKTDDVISFPIETKPGAKTKPKTPALELLDRVKSTQLNWVLPGTQPDYQVNGKIHHNVSNTINVKPDEWDSVEQFIFDNREYFCGVSMLSATGDKDYAQAPFQAIYLPSQILEYYGHCAIFGSSLIPNVDSDGDLWALCDDLTFSLDCDDEWHKKCYLFAEEHFGGDLQKVTYLVKDIWGYQRFLELKAESVRVDYTTLTEEEDNTTQQQAIACAGGKCDI